MIEIPVEKSATPEVPLTKVDVLLVLGIGGNLQLVGGDRRPVIEDQKMRINAIAAAELAAKGHLSDDTVIVTSGKGTELVDFHHKRLAHKRAMLNQATSIHVLRELQPELSYTEFANFMARPSSQTELEATAQVTQGALMQDLITRIKTKSADHQARRPITQEILIEGVARNTILNLIEALNLLDQKADPDSFWDGDMAILTTDTGHLQRAQEIARVLGLNNVTMLSAEQVLLYYGYRQDYLDRMLQVHDNELREHEKNLRAIKRIPEFLIPELIYVKNDQRLKQLIANVANYYGQSALKKYSLENYQEHSAAQVRNQIGAIGLERTKSVIEAAEESELDSLEIKGFDPDTQIEEIRAKLASGVTAGEIMRTILQRKYGNNPKWLARQDLSDLQTTEWYRIKNWLFGRILPPDKWKESADVVEWRQQNSEYNKSTEKWLLQTAPTNN